MSLKDINDNYSEILRMDCGTKPIKFDLHIHTPGSKDFCIPPNYTSSDAYKKILEEVTNSGLEIIAITDHNTFNGFNEIKKIQEKEEKYKNLLILCGIEITCFSKHILAIFNSDFSITKQSEFLKTIGIETNEEGNEDSLADELTPTNLMKKIYEFGGITILAHIDSNHGFIYDKIRKNDTSDITFSGNSLSKIFKSKYLYGLQVARETNLKKIREILNNYSFKRTDRKLGYLTFSDSHGVIVDGKYSGSSGSQLGLKYSIAKISSVSFRALKLALLEPELRILKDEFIPKNYPLIKGIAIKSILFDSSGKYVKFKFNDEMNCIIGSRGTGKSTILEILKKTLMYDLKNKTNSRISDSDVLNRFQESIVYLSYNNKVYAFYYKPSLINDNDIKIINNKKTVRAIYILDGKRFRKLNSSEYKGLQNIMVSGYDQRQLYNYTKEPNKLVEIIDDLILWEKGEELRKIKSQINYLKRQNDEILSDFEIKSANQKKSFSEYVYDNSFEKKLCSNPKSLNKINKQIRDLRIKKGEYINKLLKDKIKIKIKGTVSIDKTNYLLENFSKTIRLNEKKNYQVEDELKKIFNNIILFSTYKGVFDFFTELLEKKYDIIITEYNLTHFDNIKTLLLDIRKNITAECFSIFLEDNVILEYNVNSYNDLPILYRKNTQLSLGQNAVAILSLVLSVADDTKDARPLLLDQPEDDLDNSYIYTDLVPEFRKSKQHRQLIISTHNPNIPVSGDAENIIVLKYNGQNSYMKQNGSIDNIDISNSILEILEGGKDALEKRNIKYN